MEGHFPGWGPHEGRADKDDDSTSFYFEEKSTDGSLRCKSQSHYLLTGRSLKGRKEEWGKETGTFPFRTESWLLLGITQEWWIKEFRLTDLHLWPLLGSHGEGRAKILRNMSLLFWKPTYCSFRSCPSLTQTGGALLTPQV